jgi:outer membrane protein, multidrug efflux system
VGPEYRRPAPVGTNETPRSFSAPAGTNGIAWKTAEPAAHLPRGAWWEVFQDPELNHLEQMAASANQELAAAAARVEQARALVGVSRAAWWPDLSFGPSFYRQRTSANHPAPGQLPGASHTGNTWTIPLEAGWELDLWGRVRREVEAAQGRFAATLEDMESGRLAIQAEVAVDYFNLRALESELELLGRSVEAFRRSLELTQNRRRGGIASDLDVAQAESQLRATEAEAPAVELELANLRHALAVLCGQPATGFRLEARSAARLDVPQIPVSLPSELLERRPDISAAERRMRAANAEIGVAQAAFYPRVRLSGMAGFQSVSASTLFDWPSRAWALGPTIDLPLFTGGRNRANLAAVRAAYDEAVAQYRERVLESFQEVEDQLAARELLEQELTAQQAALVASQRTLEIANNRYRAGLVTYLEVALAQGTALARERAVVRLQSQTLAASASLIRSLGGAW